ncbi:hypothetical protein EMCRGX_G018787 [Ephydatia muelleri]
MINRAPPIRVSGTFEPHPPMTETCHLESLRKQREIDRYHQSTNKQSCSLTDDSKSTQKVPPSVAEAVGQITRLVAADSYHRVFMSGNLAKMNRRYTSTEYAMQW